MISWYKLNVIHFFIRILMFSQKLHSSDMKHHGLIFLNHRNSFVIDRKNERLNVSPASSNSWRAILLVNLIYHFTYAIFISVSSYYFMPTPKPILLLDILGNTIFHHPLWKTNWYQKWHPYLSLSNICIHWIYWCK